jgi:PAS domain-containing protein
MNAGDRLRRRIVAAGVLLIAACIGSASYDGWRLHQQIMLANERELGNLAKALAEQSLRSMQAVDVVLRDTASWYAASSGDFGPGGVSPGLASRTVGVPQVSVLTIVDAEGMQRHRSRDTGGPLSDVSDRPYFTVQRDSRDTGLFISEPMVTRTEGMPGLVVSRRIEGPNGAFAGVVTAIVTLQHLEGMYSAIQLGKGSSLLLTLSDGTLVVRQPGPTDPEKKLSFPELAALKEGGVVARAINPMDGRPKLIAAVGVGKRPLILAIMRDEEEALRPWYDEMWSSGIRTVLLILLVVLTIVGLLRQLRRQERGEQALRQSEERYAMAMEAANEGHAEWNFAQDTVFASDKWRALHGVDASVPLGTSADVLRHVHLHPDDARTPGRPSRTTWPGARTPSNSNTAYAMPAATGAGSTPADAACATRPAPRCACSAPPPTSATASSPRPTRPGSKRACNRRSGSKRWARCRAASRTTSTTSWAPSSASAKWRSSRPRPAARCAGTSTA